MLFTEFSISLSFILMHSLKMDTISKNIDMEKCQEILQIH